MRVAATRSDLQERCDARDGSAFIANPGANESSLPPGPSMADSLLRHLPAFAARLL